jgi:uncharacterized protein GlcG (DUF336 family)
MKMRLALSLTLLATVAAPAAAQAPRLQMTSATAAALRDGCMAFAADNRLQIAVAVFDHGGRLMTFARTDEVATAIGDVAQWKGKSAATYGFPSAETARWNMSAAPHIATAGGGVPVFSAQGVLLGGVGVSGAVTEDDIRCAEAGISKAGLTSRRP